MSADGRVGNSSSLVGHERAVDADDSVLWSRARAGDAEAFGVLFERHARTIYNYCFRRVGSWAAAEDLVSIVFLEAWRRLDKPLPSGKELPWLFGIATNVVRNRRRAERRYAAALGECRSRTRSRASWTTATQRVDDEELMRQRPRALYTTSPARAGGVRALRLVRAQLRGRSGRPSDPGRHRSLAAVARTGPPAGTRPGRGHEQANMQIVEETVE